MCKQYGYAWYSQPSQKKQSTTKLPQNVGLLWSANACQNRTMKLWNFPICNMENMFPLCHLETITKILAVTLIVVFTSQWYTFFCDFVYNTFAPAYGLKKKKKKSCFFWKSLLCYFRIQGCIICDWQHILCKRWREEVHELCCKNHQRSQRPHLLASCRLFRYIFCPIPMEWTSLPDSFHIPSSGRLIEHARKTKSPYSFSCFPLHFVMMIFENL